MNTIFLNKELHITFVNLALSSTKNNMLRKVIAINSARKNMAAALHLEKALEGARESGAQTEMIHLHDFNINGCKGCMSCKMLKNLPPKRCLQNDNLAPILEQCVSADALLVGGAIYMGGPNAYFRAFAERFIYPYFIYGSQTKTYYPRKDQKAALFFSMGCPEQALPEVKKGTEIWEMTFKALIGDVQTVNICSTQMVKDFSKYELDPVKPPAGHENTYEKTLEEAYNIGKRLGKQ
ncbi:NADPH-dependent FMN reductase [Tritrichomonas foetus]|uniref:NADPH-dependent FMN reductase n=1 Tax=Tritrichomonas foetus TaxID=1144522 RepID=A0A1J4JD99_9EUKA|nr:NADPH-dependent FMN reductase [Tritrichomonas foetus]|eukprot:OHS95405.1 NADPH-dependent FMN reductase [Tritrichomonas foetus]